MEKNYTFWFIWLPFQTTVTQCVKHKDAKGAHFFNPNLTTRTTQESESNLQEGNLSINYGARNICLCKYLFMKVCYESCCY